MDLSIVVVTYNHVSFLRKCIESIVAQKTSFSYEIIIGEDESNDGTRDLAQKLALEYPDKIQLRLQSRKNVIYIDGHATGRFNVVDCMKAARGKYIAFCEGDDYWESDDKIEKQLALMESSSEISGTYHNTRIMAGDELTQTFFRKQLPESITFEDTLSTVSAFHTSSFVMRTEQLKFPPFIYEITSFDMYLFALAASYGELRLVPELYSVYRKHPGGITANPALILNYHKRRAHLMTQMKSFFKRSDAKFDEIIRHHKLNSEPEVKKKSLWERIKSKF